MTSQVASRKAQGSKAAFTLVELIAVVAIAAILATVAGTYIAGYINSTKLTADKCTLATLNETLNRYKCSGGDLNALTIGAPIKNVLAKMASTINWNGLNHSVMKIGTTYCARSLSSLGSGRNYQFTRYNTYDAIAQGATSPPSSFGDGVGYMYNGGNTYNLSWSNQTTTGHLAVRDANGNITNYTLGKSGTITATTPVTFWSCAATGTAPSGDITVLNDMTVTSANFKELKNLEYLTFSYGCGLNTPLDLGGLKKLNSLIVKGTAVTSINLSGCSALQTLQNYSSWSLKSIDLTGCTALQTADFSYNSLPVLNVSMCTALTRLDVKGMNLIIDKDIPTLNAFLTSLPTFSSGTHDLYLGSYYEAGDLTIATNKGWTVHNP